MLRELFIAIVGVVAAVVGTAGGITSLVSYPALLAVGVPPLGADVANLVALVACWPGSALASRPELAGHARWLARWTWSALAGGALGSVLLLSTPPNAFRVVVPYLVAAGALALLAAPALTGLGRRGRGHAAARVVGLPLVSAYGGYFGAGSGIMTLALLLVTVDARITTANALKNMLVGAAAVVSAAVFVAFGPVDWTVAVPLGAGMFLGSLIGPRLARRVPAGPLRWLIALLGLALAIRLWLAPGITR